MDKARVSVIGVILTAVVASGLLWLVPGVTREVEGQGKGQAGRDMTSEEADAQVKAAMDALEAGINQGNAGLPHAAAIRPGTGRGDARRAGGRRGGAAAARGTASRGTLLVDPSRCARRSRDRGDAGAAAVGGSAGPSGSEGAGWGAASWKAR